MRPPGRKSVFFGARRRQRARAMVEQRDERIAKLEAALSGQAQKGAGTTPASLALPALRTDSGGLPTPPATPSDRGEWWTAGVPPTLFTRAQQVEGG